MRSYRAPLLTDEQFKAAHAEGPTLDAMAAADGRSHTATYTRANRLGLKFTNRPGGKRDTERVGKARKLRSEGMTFAQISAEVGRSVTTVWGWCRP